MAVNPNSLRELRAFLAIFVIVPIALIMTAIVLGVIEFIAQQSGVRFELILGSIMGTALIAYLLHLGWLIRWHRRKQRELINAGFVFRKYKYFRMEESKSTEILKLLSVLSKLHTQLVISVHKRHSDSPIRTYSTLAVNQRIMLLDYNNVKDLLPIWWEEDVGMTAMHFFVQPTSDNPVDVSEYLKKAGFYHCWEASVRADPTLMATPLLDLENSDLSIVSFYDSGMTVGTIYSKYSTAPIIEIIDAIITDIIPIEKQAETWRELSA